jgi:outer membrane protein W
MKKIILAACFLTFASASLNAQDFRMGLKGTFNSTWLFNNNLSDAGDEADYASTFGMSFGATSIFYLNENIGISLDVLYASNKQNIEGNYDGGVSYEAVVNASYIDLPILLRISSAGGPYVEFGPQVSFLAGATEEMTWNPSNPFFPNYTSRDVKDYFNGFGAAAVLGFGVDIEASDNWFINIGLRFGYGLTDATVKRTEEEILMDFLSEKESWYGIIAHTDVEGDYNYQKSNRAFGGFTLGVIYKLD